MQTRYLRHECLMARVLIGGATAAACALTASAQVKNWNAGDGQWGAGALWTPLGLPGLFHQVSVGNMAAAENSTVTLNVNALGQSLAITDGMTVATGASQLFISGPTTISGVNVVGSIWHYSTLEVENGPAAVDATIGALTLSDSGEVDIEGGHLVVNGLFDIQDPSRLEATGGTITLNGNGAVAMRLSGHLALGAAELVIHQNGAGRIDLDGSTEGGDTLGIAHSVPWTTDFAKLSINGTGLLDSMDNDIFMNRGNALTMNLSEGWTLGPGAMLWFGSGPEEKPPTLVAGGHLNLAGGIRATYDNASGRITAPATLEPTSWIDLRVGGELVFENTVTVDGVAATLEEGAELSFDAATTLFGGAFSTHSTSVTDGYVEFDGATTYNGALTFNGYVRQDGAASVTGPTTIDADRFDMDGTSGLTTWTIANSLVVNAEGIDTYLNDFDGTINITGGALGKLTVNLDDPTDRWTVDVAPATLNLGGVAALMTTRIAGSPLDVGGIIEVTNAVRIQADTRLLASALVDFQTPTSRLRLTGQSHVAAGSDFTGEGRLENQTDGTMTLEPFVNLGQTDLLNAGTLRIAPLAGAGAGIVLADQVIFEPTSIWSIDLGGDIGGIEHDVLHLSGAQSNLSGALEVDLIDLGGGLFLPEIGDSFIVLEAPSSSLSGAFAGSPIAYVPNNAYIWTITKESDGAGDRVRLTVANIVPCPGDVDGDGLVDGVDLGILLGSWGRCTGCDADLNLDGAVNGIDLSILLGAWGGCNLP